MENQTTRMIIFREKNLRNMLNNQFLKPIIVSIDDMNRFEKKKEIKNIGPIRSTWYDWLISYIPEPITKKCRWF